MNMLNDTALTSFKKTRFNRVASINSKVGRDINRAIILNTIRTHQPVSRTDISRMTGLNKSTVSSIVNHLIEQNLISEDINRNSEVGRNPLNLWIKKDSHFVGAIYFDSLKTELAVFDIDGTIKIKTDIKTEASNALQFIASCIDLLDELRSKSGVTVLDGIGITVAGIVDSLQSKVIYAPNLGWEDLDLGTLFRERFPTIEIITVENDAKATALAELSFGKRKINSSNFVYLSIGPGIGAGIIIDDHILGGSSHAAGEFGHVSIIDNGEQCTCGNKGCLEVYASDRATVRRYAASKGLPPEQASKLFLEDVIIAANVGDNDAKTALMDSANYIGIGIANIVRSFDPETIIIGGTITQVWDQVYPEIMKTVNERGFFGKQRNTKILPTSLEGNPPLFGAGALSIRKIFLDYKLSQ